MSRKNARVGAMQLLFLMDSNDDFSKATIDRFLENFTFEIDESEYIKSSALGFLKYKDQIDNDLAEHLKGWALNRLAKVDLAIIRLAMYELLYNDAIPVQVSINEAIELAKKYSSDDSYKYINGVLGGFMRAKASE